MRSFFILILAIGAFWAIDVYAFHGRYSQAIWQEAQSQGQQFNYAVQRFLRKLSF
jgi:hypothetical protein